MPRSKWNDGDMQGHDAYRKGQEGRHQDLGGTSYEIGSKQYLGSVLYIQLSGRGPENGAWVSEDMLKREYPAVYKKMLR